MNYDLSRSAILASLVAAALIATATPASAVQATNAQATSKARTQGQMVGVFTGEYVDGVPVYRLPSIVVVTTRKTELAKMEREAKLAHARQVRTRAAARRSHRLSAGAKIELAENLTA